MAIDQNIVNFGRQTPVSSGLQQIGNTAADVITQANQQDAISNKRKAWSFLQEAFDDNTSDERTAILIKQAAQIDPELTLGLQQKMREFNLRKSGEAAKSGAKQIGAQKILEDGTVIQSTASGPVVYNPNGEIVKGEAAARAIANARTQEVENARRKSGAKKTATLEAEEKLKGKVEAGVVSAVDAAKASNKAFERLEGINSNISAYQEAIELINEGAGTGAVESKFPSFRAASRKLDNVQKRLGLNVISNTTFGALSEGELRLALDTAMPIGLDENELKDWLIEKKQSQEKLSDYLEAAAIFLGTPGNTIPDWIKEQREQNKTSKEDTLESSEKTAPQEAIDYLMKNPQFAEQFKSKYGYIPEGM